MKEKRHISPALAAALLPMGLLPLQSCERAVALPPLSVTVLPSTQSVITAPPGAKINVGSKFVASSSAPENYSLVLSLAAANGNIVDSTENNLKNVLTILPTKEWSGPITLLTSVVVPHVADGSYKILLSIVSPDGALPLIAGPGVSTDGHNRYQIGAMNIQRAAPMPEYLPPASLDLTGYKLTFDDEFNSLSLSDSAKYDKSRWYTRNEECCMSTSDGAKTSMAGVKSEHNPYFVMAGGGLDIRLQRDGNSWYSGVLTSVDSDGVGFSQQYGYFEMKAKFPAGIDTWPAFWMLNTAAKSSHAPAGEIDIVEYIANPGFPNYIMTTLHDWSNGSTPAMSHHLVELPTDGFHTYGMMWTATTMTFYYDGSVTFQCPTPAAMHQPYYLLVDLGIGSGWPTNDTPYIDDMQIKYIRAYSR